MPLTCWGKIEITISIRKAFLSLTLLISFYIYLSLLILLANSYCWTIPTANDFNVFHSLARWVVIVGDFDTNRDQTVGVHACHQKASVWGTDQESSCSLKRLLICNQWSAVFWKAIELCSLKYSLWYSPPWLEIGC